MSVSNLKRRFKALLLHFSQILYNIEKQMKPLTMEETTMKMNLKKGTRFQDLLKEDERKEYYCVNVNGIVKELSSVVQEDGEYDVRFLDLSTVPTSRIYAASIRYLISMAVFFINPKLKLRFFYNISKSMFCKVISPKNYLVTEEFVSQVEMKMRELIDLDLPFEKQKMEKKKGLEFYNKMNLKDKADVLPYREEEFIHLYRCQYNGKNYYNYPNCYMVPSTGYLKEFKLRYYDPGFVIQTPRSDCGGYIPEFVDEKKFASSLQDTSHWQELTQLDSVNNINKFIRKYSKVALINVCETRINNFLTKVGEKILARDSKIRLICIAGPSSSGKTSFSNRLVYELMAHGLRPLRVSMDDYYYSQKDMPKNVSLESIEAIDIDCFNAQMADLIHGKTVYMPTFDFKSGEKVFKKRVTLQENQPIIIEGIHALNSLTCSNISANSKYKIYIAPQPQVNIDDISPLSMTDMRLLRRIARDARTRNTSAAETIRMWPSVREGEFKYIYPTQENADFVFDSFLPYELCALRNVVLPLLDEITIDQEEYMMAFNLKWMVRYFLPISLGDIPCNSILREFVGGTSFKDVK